MTDVQQFIVMSFGAVVALAGLWLLFLRKEGATNRIKILGQEFELSTPALIVFLVGSGIFILPFIVTQGPGKSPPENQTVPKPPHVPKPPLEKSPTTPPPPLSPDPGQEFPTKYPGVMARITRFGTTGAFTTLEITVTNGTDKDVIVCSMANIEAGLVDQEIGDSWKPVKTGGDLAQCGNVPASHESGMWMQFKVPNPEKRVFYLKSALFNRPVENLVLGKAP